MCGITAVIAKDGQNVQPEIMQKMTDAIFHRGPDDEGFFFGQGFALGHRRLSIIDLTPKGRQPLSYKDHRIIYNGEVYNFQEIRSELMEAGYAFESETDTEVILAAYDFWGEKCVVHFNGMWAFIIHDIKKNILFASRDRFGIKPLYWRASKDYFAMVSEVKQLTFLPDWEAKLNKKRAFDFLSLGYHIHTNETLFEGVFALPPGQNMVYDLSENKYTFQNYYELAQIKVDKEMTFAKAKEQFINIFEDAIKLRMIADVKIGSALSGGLDSSSIVCKMAGWSNSVETVSACFAQADYDERQWMDAVVKKTGVKSHQTFPDLDDFIKELDQMTWYHDEPIVWPALFTQYEVFRKAQEQGIVVMLDGQGADEVLAGYPKFYKPYFKNLLKESPIRAARELISFFKLHSISPKQAFQKAAAYAKKGKEKIAWIDDDFAQASYQRNPESTVREVSLNLISEVGLPALLHYEDRNSMAFSVESRLPFLDYRLVELLIKMPDKFKIKNAKRKYILRESLKGVLPDEVYRRYDKMGYETPFEEWMKKNSDFIHDELKDAMTHLNGIVNQEVMGLDDSLVVWRVIAFNRWVKRFGVGLGLGELDCRM